MVALVRTIGALDRSRISKLADWLVVGVAFSLPWSTSATSILIGLWLIALLPTLNIASLRREFKTAAGGVPVLLFLLGVIGMAWASVPLGERLHGAESFIRLLAIPLLMLQFRISPRGHYVLAAFILSCGLLLVASYVTVLWPTLLPNHYGAPVKNYIVQSAEFTVCAFALAYLAGEAGKARDMRRVVLFGLISLMFLFDIFYITTSRTTLVVLPLILVIWAARQFGPLGAVLAMLSGMLAMAVVWTSSSYLRDRVSRTVNEVHVYETQNAITPAGERLEFWKKSIQFISQAPLIGHGTGSIRDQFTNSVVGTSGVSAEISTNPHNQTFTIAIQLGLVGVAVLWAMWAAHLLLFRHDGFVNWLGLLLVLQHLGGSLFNSFLFDFTEGWLYVFGVGVLAGMVRQSHQRNSTSTRPDPIATRGERSMRPYEGPSQYRAGAATLTR